MAVGRLMRLLTLLALVVTMLPAALPSSAAAATADYCSASLARYTLAPPTRDIAPVAVARVDGQVADGARTLVADGVGATLERDTINQPAIVLDFGQLVSGTLNVDMLASSGVELRAAVSESLA